ncbi:hypothetical protein VCR12J2_1030088 [Vibrio coralliirubri]|uniref:hypothetical protein n=1 Tax=Vibrio coralliirubri TaxID=1516159 RepID=UPI0006391ED5|nr:hypothetical protein [Vibrio coralliirubri]CDT80744.1 hypothetical protein VCR12J2_1030088 [Vibrio coralliirubri]
MMNNTIDVSLSNTIRKWLHEKAELKGVSVQALIRKELKQLMTAEQSENENRKKL